MSGATAPAASAQATFSAACTPAAVTYPSQVPITCTLTVATGPQEERFTVSPRSPQFGGTGPDAEFATLSGGGQLALAGPGQLGTGAITTAQIRSCGGTLAGWHGSVNASSVRDVTIPANSVSQLSTTFATAEPPWPGDSIAPFFEIGNTMVNGDESTLAQPLTIHTAEPARTGRSGVRILFKTKPETEAYAVSATPVGFDKKVIVKGRTEPVLRNETMKLQVIGPIARNVRVRPARTKFRTSRKGRFKTSFRTSAGRGIYEIGLLYRSDTPALADGYTCGRQFVVGGRRPAK